MPVLGGSPVGSNETLADVSYAPTSAATFTVSSTTLVDVDATNAKITVKAPADGVVWIRTSLYKTNGPSAGSLIFALRDSGGTQVGQQQNVGYNMGEPLQVHPWFRIAGLTPGQSYTYYLQWRVTAGTSGLSASANAPLLMRADTGK